ncbi:MAG: hypothetical protein ACYDH0_01675 [Candidatus Aminicenantales bacterium]
MNFKKLSTVPVFAALLILASRNASAVEIFIHHPGLNRTSLVSTGKVILHGELFFHRLSPSTFPSYNDQSGPADRWNLGFQDFFPITPTTTIMAQLLTHDDGAQRTKFDWHFELRQAVLPWLIAAIGHDSDHDAEHRSTLLGKPYYANRNFIGVGIPVEGSNFFVEPFTRFFHHTNQRSFLDFSGEVLRQEFGLRASAWTDEGLSAHAQAYFQTDKAFSLGQAFLGELILRWRVLSWLDLSLGGTIWTDIKTGPLGEKRSFHKLVWGIAIPF